jgi:hypothetical protein
MNSWGLPLTSIMRSWTLRPFLHIAMVIMQSLLAGGFILASAMPSVLPILGMGWMASAICLGAYLKRYRLPEWEMHRLWGLSEAGLRLRQCLEVLLLVAPGILGWIVLTDLLRLLGLEGAYTWMSPWLTRPLSQNISAFAMALLFLWSQGIISCLSVPFFIRPKHFGQQIH